MNRDLYLIQITTITGRVLYIDDATTVWSLGSFGSLEDGDVGPIYYDDFEEAKDMADVYGGEVVRCRFAIEPTKDRKAQQERTCYNCKHGALGFDGELGCDFWHRGVANPSTCGSWEGTTK